MINPSTLGERTMWSPHGVTREMYHRMGELGIFEPDARVELLEGEIIEMSPIGRLHARCVNWLNERLVRLLSGQFIVSPQNPVVLDDFSEPQPDIVVFRWREDFYADATPGARESVIVIEVADSTIRFDRNRKIPIYGRRGIPEAWLIDLTTETVEVYSQPSEDGYAEKHVFQRGDRLTSTSIPAIDIDVNQLFG